MHRNILLKLQKSRLEVNVIFHLQQAPAGEMSTLALIMQGKPKGTILAIARELRSKAVAVGTPTFPKSKWLKFKPPNYSCPFLIMLSIREQAGAQISALQHKGFSFPAV